jgi:hypothetical protein
VIVKVHPVNGTYCGKFDLVMDALARSLARPWLSLRRLLLHCSYQYHAEP